MAHPKCIILTGASRGIGLAIARYLLGASHKVFLVARSAEPLEKLKEEYPEQVGYIAADLSDFSRIADSDPEEWRSSFDVNFFSAVAFIKPALPHLRHARGRIILTSSGAAINSYSTWGAYGSAKAALNHLAITLSLEEPEISTIAIRPGVVDTDMQVEVRGHDKLMDEKDTKKFKSLYEEGKLLRPEQPGNVMARLVVEGGIELSGKFLSWNDKALEQFQGL
ncbi:hypothetical protein B7494_g4909 [Chlorociboria aeruginascens]|nr:hypothetical protein B7494_g4909 [Chlorociboria aeruginascens]